LTAFLAALWTFANSNAGQLLLLALFGAALRRGVQDKTRRQKLLEYASLAFDVAEMMGARQGLGGRDKYFIFLREVAKKLKAAGERELTAQESQLLEQVAFERSWIAKPRPAPVPKLPLPPLPPPKEVP
jgi:hypothetical protein